MQIKSTPFRIFLLIALIWNAAIDQVGASPLPDKYRDAGFSILHQAKASLNNDSISLKPVANAGADMVVAPGVKVTLDGSDSYDAAGNQLTYHWIFPSGIYVAVPDSSRISFIAPSPSRTTTYRIILVVNNGDLTSDPDTLRLTVQGTPVILKSAQTAVQVYPNPFSSNLNVKLSSDWQEESNVRIFNAIGVLALEKKMSGYEYNVEVSELPAGIYFLEIRDGKNILNRRLLKK